MKDCKIYKDKPNKYDLLTIYIEELFQREVKNIDIHLANASELLSLNPKSLYSVTVLKTSFSNPIILDILEGELFEKTFCYELVGEKKINFEKIFPFINFPRRKIENYSIKSMRVKSPKLKELIDKILSEDLGVVLKSWTVCSPKRVDYNNNYLSQLELLIGYAKGITLVEQHRSSYDCLKENVVLD